MTSLSNSKLFPDTTEINKNGHVSIGGCDVPELVGKFGSPLYLFDEETIRSTCREYVAALKMPILVPTSLMLGKHLSIQHFLTSWPKKELALKWYPVVNWPWLERQDSLH